MLLALRRHPDGTKERKRKAFDMRNRTLLVTAIAATLVVPTFAACTTAAGRDIPMVPWTSSATTFAAEPVAGNQHFRPLLVADGGAVLLGTILSPEERQARVRLSPEAAAKRLRGLILVSAESPELPEEAVIAAAHYGGKTTLVASPDGFRKIRIGRPWSIARDEEGHPLTDPVGERLWSHFVFAVAAPTTPTAP